MTDVYLAALLLELFQLVGRDAADDLTAYQRSERDEVVTAEQSLEIRCIRSVPTIGVHFIEDFTESR